MYLKKTIRRILRCLTQKGQTNEDSSKGNLQRYARIGNSICNDVNLRLEDPEDGRIYLTIGNDCIVSGNYIFESKQGKIEIGQHCFIGYSTFISRSSISIGNNVTIAWGCTIYDHNSHSLDYLERRKDIDDELWSLRNGQSTYKNKNWNSVKSSPITICDDAWIGMNCIILKGVTIGEGAVVGAGSVVTKDVPAWTVVAGNPAKTVKTLVR